MIPAFLETPAAKIVASLGLAAVLGLAYVGWREYQQFIGRQEERAKYYAELLEQQQEATGHYIVREALKFKTVERTMAEKDRLHAQLRQTYQTIVQHDHRTVPVTPGEAQDGESQHQPMQSETNQDCYVAPDLVRTVNDMARVLNDTAEERDATPGGAAGQPTP